MTEPWWWAASGEDNCRMEIKTKATRPGAGGDRASRRISAAIVFKIKTQCVCVVICITI